MKTIVLIALIGISSCSYLECFKQIQVLIPSVEAAYQDYENSNWDQLIQDVQTLVPQVEQVLSVCQQQQMVQTADWNTCIQDVLALVQKVESLKQHLDSQEYSKIIAELPEFLAELRVVQSDCQTQKVKLLGSDEQIVRGPVDCIADVRTLIVDAERVVEEYQNGEYDFRSLVSELQTVYQHIQKSYADCKSIAYIPSPSFIRSSLKKSMTTPQTCFSDLANIKTLIAESLKNLEEENLEEIVQELSQSLQQFTQDCVQKPKLLKETRLSRDFKKCFALSYKLLTDMKKLNDDYQGQQTEFNAIMDELDLLVKEVDPVLIVCDAPVEEQWHSLLPDTCVDNLGVTVKLANVALTDYNLGKSIQVVKDLQKLIVQFNDTKQSCPFIH